MRAGQPVRDGIYATSKVDGETRIKGQAPFFPPLLFPPMARPLTEVVIDTLTGENRILRADLLHDAGASRNALVSAQNPEGGYGRGRDGLIV